MSRETEKVFKAIHEYLDKHATVDMGEEEINDLIQTFLDEASGPRMLLRSRVHGRPMIFSNLHLTQRVIRLNLNMPGWH